VHPIASVTVTGQSLIDDDGKEISASAAGLYLDNDLYDVWRKSCESTNGAAVLVRNAVSVDRLRVSEILLTRIGEWLEDYMSGHANNLPETIDAMPAEDRICPISAQAFRYFPVHNSPLDDRIILATVPSGICHESHTGTLIRVGMLLGSRQVAIVSGPEFRTIALSNNVIRAQYGDNTVSTNLIERLCSP
jgi:hypothetical protein